MNSIKYIESSAKPKENQNLVMCGANHKTSTVEERELFQVPKSELNRALYILKEIKGVDESLLLCTCNRIEFYLVLADGFEAFKVLKEFYLRFKNLNVTDYENKFYIRHGTSVPRHLFKVVCGLDSLVLGEYQIQGQVKDAYSMSCSNSNPGKIVHRLFHFAFRIGKYIRTETSIGKTTLSVAGAASELVKKKSDFNDTIAFIGVNENIKILVENLSKSGFHKFIFFNRTVAKAEIYSETYGGSAYGIDKIKEQISSADIIISCSGAPDFILNSQDLREILDSSDLKLVIDLGVPRNIEINDDIQKRITYINLDNIHEILKLQDNNFEQDMTRINDYIEEQIIAFQSWFNSRNDAVQIFWTDQIELIRLQTIREFSRDIQIQSKEQFEIFSRLLTSRIQTQIIQSTKLNKKKLEEENETK